MTREEERAIIARGRDLWSDASSGVTERMKGGEHLLEGRIIPEAAPAPILIFHPEADYRDIAFYTIAHRLVEALLQSRDRLIDHYNSQNPPPSSSPAAEMLKKPVDHARDCAIHCGKPMFQKFMFERHGLEHASDPIRMRTRIHSLLAIASRTELNTDDTARNRWLSLRAEYKVWKEGKL
jgi:hypothetical protein